MQSPIATDSSTDPAAPVETGSVLMTLESSALGQPTIALSIDQGWLHDSHRVFPIHLDLPIVTSDWAANSGLFGTLNSCAPNEPAPQTAVIVGSEGSCTYHGLLYFNVDALMYDTPIVSAVLHLFTPNQSGPTGVQVFPNTPPSSTSMPYQPRSWDQPSWSTAPIVTLGAVGIAQGGSNGHWQSWDITNLVQQWVRNGRTNTGLTLTGGATPVLFASPRGIGSDSPTSAPYLDITYAPRPTVTPQYNDGAAFIYGVSGSFTADTYTTGCSSTTNVCNGDIRVVTVAHGPNSPAPTGPGGLYIRVGVTLSCNAQPGSSYWNSTAADPFNNGTINDILTSANNDGLIPIVNFNAPPTSQCTQYPNGVLPASNWESEVKDFVTYMTYPTTKQIYFEIGNEVNYNTAQYPTSLYSSDYGSAAKGLRDALGDSHTTYHILTAGMLDPTADDSQCSAPSGNVNIVEASNAIGTAISTYGVSYTHLGIGIHPYHYNTSEPSYWKNYYTEYPYYDPTTGQTYYNSYAGTCGNLQNMLSLWLGTKYFPAGIPVVATEDNWSTQPTSELGHCSSLNGCESTYIIDLFTWLFDHTNCSGCAKYANASVSPLRLMIYRGGDTSGQQLGIYGMSGQQKNFALNSCSNPSINNTSSALSNDYYYLRGGYCYL